MKHLNDFNQTQITPSKVTIWAEKQKTATIITNRPATAYPSPHNQLLSCVLLAYEEFVY